MSKPRVFADFDPEIVNMETGPERRCGCEAKALVVRFLEPRAEPPFTHRMWAVQICEKCGASWQVGKACAKEPVYPFRCRRIGAAETTCKRKHLTPEAALSCAKGGKPGIGKTVIAQALDEEGDVILQVMSDTKYSGKSSSFSARGVWVRQPITRSPDFDEAATFIGALLTGPLKGTA